MRSCRLLAPATCKSGCCVTILKEHTAAKWVHEVLSWVALATCEQALHGVSPHARNTSVQGECRHKVLSFVGSSRFASRFCCCVTTLEGTHYAARWVHVYNVAWLGKSGNEALRQFDSCPKSRFNVQKMAFRTKFGHA